MRLSSFGSLVRLVCLVRTNVTPTWVTNLLLDKVCQMQGRLEILESGTPDLPLEMVKRFTSVKI